MELATISSVIVMGLVMGSLYALIGVGLNLLYGTMRLLNVAHGDLIMLGAYAAWMLFSSWGVSPLLTGILSIFGGAILGWIIYKVLFARDIMAAESTERLETNSLLIFFGISIIFQNLASLIWGADVRGYSYLTKGVDILGATLAWKWIVGALIALVVCGVFYFVLQRTLFGKGIRAVIQDKTATQLVGIDTNKMYMFCFCSALALAALAGSLMSMFYTISPFIGLQYTLTGFIVIVIGGLGNIKGSLFGGLLLGLVVTAVVSLTTPGFSFVVLYLIFILVILFRPQGIFGKAAR
jgi:branched-chain amino acid transport system permease protein